MDAENWEPLWQIPEEWAGDPLFEHELCLELGVFKAELYHGRGSPMPLSELMEWKLFYASRARTKAAREAEQHAAAERQRRRIS